jgi:hypothetical protein
MPKNPKVQKSTADVAVLLSPTPALIGSEQERLYEHFCRRFVRKARLPTDAWS